LIMLIGEGLGLHGCLSPPISWHSVNPDICGPYGCGHCHVSA
jgi:hypothetical protein